MIPLKMTIAGAKGILAGMGRKSFSLDFESMVPGSAITIAIKGDNGTGKSTILNLGLTPWIEPPQIEGSIYDHFGEAGFRELLWSHAGNRYMTTIKLKQTQKTRSQAAYLRIQTANGEWEPVKLEDNTRSDGKVGTYNRCLESILGAQDVYYLSAFRAQNAAQLVEHKDPKGLMRHLLNLDEPAKLALDARKVEREIARLHDDVRNDLSKYDAYDQDIADLNAQIAEIIDGEGKRATTTLNADEALSAAKAELDAVLSRGVDEQRIIDRKRKATARLQAAKAAMADIVKQANLPVQIAKDSAFKDEEAGKAERTKISGQIERTAKQIGEYQRIIDDSEKILAAAIKTQSLKDDINLMTTAVADKDASIAKIQESAEKLWEIKFALKGVEQRAKSLKESIDSAKMRASFVSEVPCRGAGVFATCPALVDAKAASTKVASLKDLLASAREDWKAKDAERESCAQDASPLGAETMARDGLFKDIAAARREIASLAWDAERASLLDHAEKAIAELAAQLSVIESERHNLTINQEKTARRHQAEIAEAEEDAARFAAQQENEVSILQAELDSMPNNTDYAEVLSSAKSIVSKCSQSALKAKGDQEMWTGVIASKQARIKAMEDDIAASSSLRKKERALSDARAEWKLLGLGLIGIIDMTIEAAGPAIATIANDLLKAAYGARFSIQIVSQRMQQNGRLVECFDVSVIDANSGIESTALFKSGGESVWLDKALTDAVAIYQRGSTGLDYECLFADESEDGLTGERKAQFYKMDREAIRVGGYQRKFSVSHNPEAWAMSDFVIDLDEIKACAET